MKLSDTSYNSRIISPQTQVNPTNTKHIVKRDNVSFKGMPVTKVFSTLESNPMLALATIDFFGMVVPRTLIDINRNKGELGHLNYDAGRETLMREVFSSSILFFLPGILSTYMGDKILTSKFNPYGINTKAFTDYKTISAVEKKLGEILTKEALAGRTSVPINEIRKKLAESLMRDVTAAYTGKAVPEALIKEVVDEVGGSMKRANIERSVKNFTRRQMRQEYQSAFEAAKQSILKTNPQATGKALEKEAARLAREAIAPSAKNLEVATRKALIIKRDKSIGNFLSRFIPKLNTQLRGDSEAVLAVKGAKPVASSTGNIVRDVFFATDDVVTKAANGAETIKIDKLRAESAKVLKSARKLKVAKTLLPVAIVFGLLTFFPKFQNWLTKQLNGGKDQFPGLAGISKDGKEEKVSFSSNKAETQQTVAEIKVDQNFSKPAPQVGTRRDHSVPTQQQQPAQYTQPITVNRIVNTTPNNPYSDNVFAAFERRVGR
jgi:hypothetical protein